MTFLPFTSAKYLTQAGIWSKYDENWPYLYLLSGSYIDRAQVSGKTLGTPFSSIIGSTASICGVPPLLIDRKMLSRFTSLFIACTALGTRYSMSSQMKRT